MPRRFCENGISFTYPDNWRLEREDTDSGWTVSLFSPDTAFLILTCDPGMPTVEEVTETALEALRSDYPELEADATIEMLAGQPAIGHDVNFFSMDLTATCWIRSLYSDAGTLLLLCQAADLDLERHQPVLRAICSSLKVDDEEEIERN